MSAHSITQKWRRAVRNNTGVHLTTHQLQELGSFGSLELLSTIESNELSPAKPSPYIVGAYWLGTRRDEKGPGIWQIASARGRTIVYRSTCTRELSEAKARLLAHVEEERARTTRQAPDEASVAAVLVIYFREKGSKVVNSD